MPRSVSTMRQHSKSSFFISNKKADLFFFESCGVEFWKANQKTEDKNRQISMYANTLSFFTDVRCPILYMSVTYADGKGEIVKLKFSAFFWYLKVPYEYVICDSSQPTPEHLAKVSLST